MIQDFKEDMMKTFEMSDLGLMHFFLGIELNQEKEGIFICQKKYTETLLKKFKMESCKTVTTPLVTGEKYQKEDGSQKVDGSMHRSLIGSLLYLTATRPDIMFATSLLSRFMQSPSQVHYGAAKKDSKILTRNILMASKKQATVAQSSAEAEYIAAAATSNQAIWLRRILEDIGEKQEEPTTIYCDNKSAIAITKNPVQHSRTKHIDIKYHSLREATTRGEIELKYCGTEEQLADIFTKALPRNKFEELRMKIGPCSPNLKPTFLQPSFLFPKTKILTHLIISSDYDQSELPFPGDQPLIWNTVVDTLSNAKYWFAMHPFPPPPPLDNCTSNHSKIRRSRVAFLSIQASK
ncbi:Retrovirus-related Pol polyprotein from transposon TNT 1-94 [Sesamum angolense]|uniref:Retrovirus-related Pol polyprotein from transposon TNT 1-94 n=1 Tax=Sesamum angolense TaxID=2727404 RepID=A0AAE1WX80_9LAMI|nr:Retrovirus-related Pol polyprotein from transposon TNT 1-94 [Sesamum angolense]